MHTFCIVAICNVAPRAVFFLQFSIKGYFCIFFSIDNACFFPKFNCSYTTPAYKRASREHEKT